MISHHIIYDITCSVFITSPSLYLKWHLPYLCHHNDSIDCLRPTVCMTSHPLYVCHRLHSTQRYIHSLWLHTIELITLHPLHSGHHTHYIWHHTHGNRNVISSIWPTISNTTSTVSVSSNSRYELYHTHSLYNITHTIRVTSYSVSMLSQKYLWHYTPLCITSHPVYLWHHIQYVRYHHTAFITTQLLYLIFHPPYLTSQPLYLSHHTDGTHICIDALLYQWHHHKCVSCHVWHTYGITPNVHHIIFTLYDISYHVLSHHTHCIHDIRSPLYHITSTL